MLTSIRAGVDPTAIRLWAVYLHHYAIEAKQSMQEKWEICKVSKRYKKKKMGEGKIRKGTNGKFKYKEMGNKKERNAT